MYKWWMLLENITLRRGALQAAQVICMSAHCCCSRPELCYSRGRVHGMLPLRSGGSGSAVAGGHASSVPAWRGSSAGGALLVPPAREQGSGRSCRSPQSRKQAGVARAGSHRQIRLGRCFMEYANPGMEKGLNNYTHSQIFFK